MKTTDRAAVMVGLEVHRLFSAVTLAEFQGDAVKKARRILSRYDGVLIADSVGLGFAVSQPARRQHRSGHGQIGYRRCARSRRTGHQR